MIPRLVPGKYPSSIHSLTFSMKNISFVSERLPASSLRLLSMLGMLFGSDSNLSGFICITHISSGPEAHSSRTGGFCENKPSQHTDPWVCTALNKVGIAVEARIASAVILSLRLLKALKSPLQTSTAPISNIGLDGFTSSWSLPKSMCFSSVRLSRSCPEVGSWYGLMVGAPPMLAKNRLIWHIQSFTNLSQGELAEISLQKEPSRSMDLLTSFVNNPYQANEVQMAPPEVPIKATMS